MQRRADQLICDVGAIIIAGVDMVYALGDCCAQHGQRRVTIFRRSEHARAGQLHRTEAQSFHRAIAKRKRTGVVEIVHLGNNPKRP